ncbi:MAG: ATP-binding protein [Methylacidiphilales bacterium]|nr:ATP-binding protein [Candidatus Methylacidiphilales bacterium]
MIRRGIHDELLKRLKEKRRFLQVLAGPRQVGKTTLVRQVMAAAKMPAHYASADEPALRGRTWLEQQWDLARLKAGEGKNGALLVLDEIQKIPGWSNVVKLLWDADTHAGVRLKVVLLGSAPLLIQSGLTESLAGRFEVIAVPHWSFPEMREAFGWNLEQYIFYGAYPGAAELIGSPERWRRYIQDSLIETTISRDILLLTRVDKPALLRRLFHLGCAYSGQILSYQKMLGQLTDAGNTVTLAHYLELLQGAGMLAGLAKYSHGQVRQRGSSPKLQALNTALISAQDPRSLAEARRDGDYWGRIVESCMGAHLLNSSLGTDVSVTYWRERNHEVDFVLQKGKTVAALEVKSGGRRESLPGMDAFARQFRPKRQLLVGGQGIPLEEFLSQPAASWLC